MCQQRKQRSIGERIKRIHITLRNIKVFGQAGSLVHELANGDVAVGKGRQIFLHRIIVLQFALLFQHHSHHGIKLFAYRCQVKSRSGCKRLLGLRMGDTKCFFIKHFSFFTNQYRAVEEVVLMQVGEYRIDACYFGLMLGVGNGRKQYKQEKKAFHNK